MRFRIKVGDAYFIKFQADNYGRANREIALFDHAFVRWFDLDGARRALRRLSERYDVEGELIDEQGDLVAG